MSILIGISIGVMWIGYEVFNYMNGVPTTIETIYEIGSTLLNSGVPGVEQAPLAPAEVVEPAQQAQEEPGAIGEEGGPLRVEEREATLWERMKGLWGRFWMPNWYSRGRKKGQEGKTQEPKSKVREEEVQERVDLGREVFVSKEKKLKKGVLDTLEWEAPNKVKREEAKNLNEEGDSSETSKEYFEYETEKEDDSLFNRDQGVIWECEYEEASNKHMHKWFYKTKNYQIGDKECSLTQKGGYLSFRGLANFVNYEINKNGLKELMEKNKDVEMKKAIKEAYPDEYNFENNYIKNKADKKAYFATLKLLKEYAYSYEYCFSKMPIPRENVAEQTLNEKKQLILNSKANRDFVNKNNCNYALTKHLVYKEEKKERGGVEKEGVKSTQYDEVK